MAIKVFVFNSARLKLTLWYLLIIMAVSVSFSLVIYEVLSSEVQRFAAQQRIRFENRMQTEFFVPAPYSPEIQIDTDLIQEIQRRLIISLLAVNGGIAIVAGVLGYMLAGRTLYPIKVMIDEQNRFITDSSHELRTPLTSLKSSVEVSLRDKHLTVTEARTVLQDSLEEVNKLQSLAEGLLQLAQYQKPENNLEFTRVSIKEMVEKAVRQVEPQAKAKTIHITQYAQDLKIEANPYGLTDLLVILLENAIKYSTVKSSITIATLRTDGHIQMTVQDEGIGIEANDLPHIFDRFYRADMARSKTKASGYGLGLSIAKKIADAHHGQIQVESQVKRGSRFTVTLPIRQTTGLR